jgi:hypothetical protein
MKYRYILFLLLGIDALILFFQTTEVSISAAEAELLYGSFSFLQLLIKSSLYIFGQNDFGLRFVMIALHISSALLLYKISKNYVHLQRNRLWLVLLFIMLPGVVSSAIVVNNAGLIIFGLFLYIYISQSYSQKYSLVLLFFLALINYGFLYLFAGIIIYALFQNKKQLLIFNMLFMTINIAIYGFDLNGIPRGHFLDTIGVYSAIFTPIIFLYIIYTLYRKYLTNKLDQLWYISSTALLYSLILSFRQQVALEYFAPYLIIALPLSAQTFISSYRVRLKIFRKRYKFIFTLAFLFLFANFMVVLFNKELYLFLDNPKKHFAYKMHVAKELAASLKQKGILCVHTDNDMALRLKFYGIEKCNQNLLKESSIKERKNDDVTISYRNKIIYSASVTNLNNK